LANSDVEVLEASSVAAHVQRVGIIDLDVIAAVIALADPELCIRLALQDVARLYEGFAQTELVVSGGTIEIRVAGRVCSVRLEHDFGLEPRLVGIALWIEPIVDKNKLAVGFRFVS